MSTPFVALSLTFLLTLGCAATQAPPAAVEAPRAASAAAGPSRAEDTTPRLEYELEPELTANVVRVRARVWSKPRDALTFQVAADPAVAIKARNGAAELTAAKQPGLLVYRVPAAQQPVTLELEVAVRTGDFDDLAGVGVGPDILRASLRSLLPVPAELLSERLPTTLSVREKSAPKSELAFTSSIELAGPGVSLPVALVPKIGVLGGKLGRADFELGAQRDRLVWVGALGFDPRPVAGDLALIRTALSEYFGLAATKPFTLLLTATMIQSGEFRLAPLTGGLMVDMNAGGGWTDRLRLAVTKAMVNDFLARSLQLRARDAQHRSEVAWFEHGVARYLAREVLFSVGALNPEEYAGELNRLSATLATSLQRDTGNDQLPETSSARALGEARGALHAAFLDAELARKSQGKQGLRQLLRALGVRARASNGELPREAWVEEASRALGEDARASFERQVLNGRQTELPAGTFGVCFVPAQQRFTSPRLGFELGESGDGKRVIEQLDPSSPAALAGARAGDEVALQATRTSPKGDVIELGVRRDGQSVPLSFVPLTNQRAGQAWKPRKDVPESQCHGPSGAR